MGEDDDTPPRDVRRRLLVMRRKRDDSDAPKMSPLEKTIRRLRVLIVAVAIPAGSSVLLVGKYLYKKGAENEAAKIEHQRMQEKVDESARIAHDAFIMATQNTARLEDIQRELDRLRSNP